MLFVCSKKSCQHKVAHFFSTLYDGTSKAYPNGIMMLFIPLHDNIEASYCQKVIFNHNKYLGDETALAIQGLNNLSTIIKLKNDQTVSLWMSLHSLPATQGMSTPQLFQLIETNPSRSVVLVTYQQGNKNLVHARKLLLQELRSLLAEGESSKVFQTNSDGLWFDAISKAKDGRLWSAHNISKSNLDHIQRTQSILSSPPKKRTFVSVPEPNPHHPTQQCTQSFVTVTLVGRPQGTTVTPNPEFQK
jgi:hypothetical protein